MTRAATVLLGFALLLGSPVATAAEQALQLAVRTDRPEAVYAKGETVTFIIEMQHGDQPVAEALLDVELSADAFEHSERRQVVLRAGRAEVQGSRPEPSLLWIRATCTPAGGRAVRAMGGAAFSHEEIRAPMSAPDDFDQFWEAQKALVDAVPMNPVLTPMPSPDACKLFSVTLAGLGGTKVTGYLARPAGPGPFPGLVRFQGAGVSSVDPDKALGYARMGYLAFAMNAHDIDNGQPQEYYDRLMAGRLAGYMFQGRESRETTYFRAMYLRCYRAAEFVASRPDWNGRTLAVHGHSMGGGQGLACAALSPHVTALAIDAPGMCDYAGVLVGRATGRPRLVIMNGAVPDPVTFTTARYMDGVNFASRITAPAIVGVAFQDLSCPSSGVFAAYNALRGPKEVAIDPLCGHMGDKPNWSRLLRAFLREHRDEASAPTLPRQQNQR
ncbi:MAG: acetylxylan esterase [Candidatus Brocadiaceae bacterium]|nr:acetylxylan esterase [Candidatus Brocadiaceae bacterium]